VIADHNYGEGSAREHAAMQPRYLGGRVVVAKSFARIHETNLKKQGMLPLIFKNVEDYDKVTGKDKISVKGLTTLTRDHDLTLVVSSPGKTSFEIPVTHTLNEDQIEWFKAGSALNAAAKEVAK